MPLSRISAPIRDQVVAAGFHRIRADLDIPDGFPAAVTAEAGALHDPRADPGRVDRRDLPLVTIDPPGSRDLDQALAIEDSPGGGHIVWYAIADVAAFVMPGGAIDAESRARGVTLYAPDGRAPLHPPALSEDAASLLADRDRPAVLWRLTLDPDGGLVDVTVGRAVVRSRAQLTYAQAQARIDAGDETLSRLRTVGERRQAVEVARGGVSLPIPDQEVVRDDAGYRLTFDAPLPVEGWNAQLSLLCGMAAADLLLANGVGLLRTLPPANADTTATLRRHALALGIDWPAEAGFGDVVRAIDPSSSAGAAFLVQSTRLFRGADYQPLGATVPEDVLVHAAIAAPYAHVTAPLRRLGDRFATEAVLAAVAGRDVPSWAADAMDSLPGLLRAGTTKAAALERAVVDHLEAVVLSGHVGESFDAVVVDRRRRGAVVQIRHPAIVATIDEDLDLGAEVTVVPEAVDLATSTVGWRVL